MKQKKKILLLTLATLFVVLLVVALLGKFVFGWFDPVEENPSLPELEEGEAYYYLGDKAMPNVVLLFPQLGRKDLCEIKVHNTKGENYFFFHNQSYGSNYFVLGQCDSGWNWDESNLYYPPILDATVGAFDYTSLYDDTSTIPQMLAAVGAVNISERIRPAEGEDFDTWLGSFGLAPEDDPAYFELVTYLRDGNGNYIYAVAGTDRYVGISTHDGKYYYIDPDAPTALGEEYTGPKSALAPMADTEGIIRVYVGNPTVDDRGYYLYLEGRPVVYTTQNAYLPDVVERNIGYYVYPRLISQSETQYSYQLTPNLTYWKGQYYGIDSKVEVTEDMRLTLDAPVIWEVDSDGGQERTTYDQELVVDLAADGTNPAWLTNLLGKTIGGAPVDAIIPSINLYEIGREGTATYTIYGVEGILRGGKYNNSDPLTVMVGDRVILRYSDGSLAADGTLATYFGYVNLANPLVHQDLAVALIGLTRGETVERSVTVEYTADSEAYRLRLALLSIDAILGEDGGEATVATYGTTVRVTYLLFETEPDGEEVSLGTVTTDLTIPKEAHYNDPDAWREIYNYADPRGEMYTMQAIFGLLLGKEKGSYTDEKGSSTAEVVISYPKEAISDFALYRGASITAGNRYDLELSFGFTNDRDIYHGGSLYEILAPEDKTMYGLDSNATLAVLEHFQSLSGDETVALGLTDEAMTKYGLYAYRLYFELPYNIYTISDGDDTRYYYRDKVGFTLYISEKNQDGSRYLGSDLYDIVVRYDAGEHFDFLEWSFHKGWVQNSLLMVSYEDLRQMVFDIQYENYQHVWGLDICVDRDYYYETSYVVGGEEQISYANIARLYASLVDGGESMGGNSYGDLISVLQYKTPYADREDYSEYELHDPRRIHTIAGRFVRTYTDSLRYITELANGRDLDEIYKENGITDFFSNKDYGGAYYTKTLLQILNSAHYWGTVEEDLRAKLPDGMTKEEQDREIERQIAAILADEDSRVLTLALTLDDGSESSGYVYRFYNYSYHSLVSVAKVNADGTEEVSNLFYIQAREVEKIAKAVIALSEGRAILPDEY